MTGWGWAMMTFWTLLWVGLLSVLAWAVISWARGSRAPSQPSAQHATPNARELLDRRLAGGEITIEEYKARESALDDRPDGAP